MADYIDGILQQDSGGIGSGVGSTPGANGLYILTSALGDVNAANVNHFYIVGNNYTVGNRVAERTIPAVPEVPAVFNTAALNYASTFRWRHVHNEDLPRPQANDLYFNAQTRRFRLYHNGAWQDSTLSEATGMGGDLWIGGHSGVEHATDDIDTDAEALAFLEEYGAVMNRRYGFFRQPTTPSPGSITTSRFRDPNHARLLHTAEVTHSHFPAFAGTYQTLSEAAPPGTEPGGFIFVIDDGSLYTRRAETDGDPVNPQPTGNFVWSNDPSFFTDVGLLGWSWAGGDSHLHAGFASEANVIAHFESRDINRANNDHLLMYFDIELQQLRFVTRWDGRHIVGMTSAVDESFSTANFGTADDPNFLGALTVNVDTIPDTPATVDQWYVRVQTTGGPVSALARYATPSLTWGQLSVSDLNDAVPDGYRCAINQQGSGSLPIQFSSVRGLLDAIDNGTVNFDNDGDDLLFFDVSDFQMKVLSEYTPGSEAANVYGFGDITTNTYTSFTDPNFFGVVDNVAAFPVGTAAGWLFSKHNNQAYVRPANGNWEQTESVNNVIGSGFQWIAGAGYSGGNFTRQEVERMFRDGDLTFDAASIIVFYDSDLEGMIRVTASDLTERWASFYGYYDTDADRPATIPVETNTPTRWIYNRHADSLGIEVWNDVDTWLQENVGTFFSDGFPSGYTWVNGTDASDGDYTEAELLAFLEAEDFTYDAAAPLLYLDSDDRLLESISAYTPADLGSPVVVSQYTPSVPEVPSYIEKYWEAVTLYTTPSSGLSEGEVQGLIDAYGRPFTQAQETKLGTVEDNAKDDQTAIEIRDLLQTLTNADRLDVTAVLNAVAQSVADTLLNGASINGSILTLTKLGTSQTPISLTLPTSGGMADGVVTSNTVDVATQTVTLTTSTNAQIVINLSPLLTTFITEADADARAALRFTDAEKTKLGTVAENANHTTDAHIDSRADARAVARYTDLEKTKLGTVETNANEVTDDEIDARAALRFTDDEKAKLAALVAGSQRAESVTMQGTSAIVHGSPGSPLLSIMNDPVTVEHGDGVATMLSVDGNTGVITVDKAGVYDFFWSGRAIISVDRADPILRIFRNADVVGTDEPLSTSTGEYERFSNSNTQAEFNVIGKVIIDADGQTIKLIPDNAQHNITGTSPAYSVVNGSKITFFRNTGSYQAPNGGPNTDLTIAARDSDSIDLRSSTQGGDDLEVPGSTPTLAGLQSGAHHTKLEDTEIYTQDEKDKLGTLEEGTTDYHIRVNRIFVQGGSINSSNQIMLVPGSETGTTVLSISEHTDLPEDYLDHIARYTRVVLTGSTPGDVYEGWVLNVDNPTETSASITLETITSSGAFSNNENITVDFGFNPGSNRVLSEAEITDPESDEPGLTTGRLIHSAIAQARSLYLGVGQTDLFTALSDHFTGTTGGPFAVGFGATAHEDINGGVAVTFTDTDANADVTEGLTGKYLSFPAGRYDILFQAKSNTIISDENKDSLAIALMKSQSGTDDKELCALPVKAIDARDGITYLFTLDIRSLVAVAGDVFYFEINAENDAYAESDWLGFTIASYMHISEVR